MSVRHRGIDPRQILHDNPASADIHVANLGIADLTFGQPDRGAGGGQSRPRPVAAHRIEDRRVGERHGVAVARLAQPPAIHDAQDDGTGR